MAISNRGPVVYHSIIAVTEINAYLRIPVHTQGKAAVVADIFKGGKGWETILSCLFLVSCSQEL